MLILIDTGRYFKYHLAKMKRKASPKKTKDTIAVEYSEEYISRIQQKYNAMSASEKRIADFLIHNGHQNNIKYNINSLAEELGVSAATVVRFCRTLGFSGFREFFYYMQRGIPSPLGSDTKVEAKDSIHTIVRKISHLLIKTTNFVAESVDEKSLARAIDVIAKSKTILFCGSGTSGGLAQVAASIFQNTGIKCLHIPDELVQIRFAHTLEPNDLVIGITNCGYIKTVVDTLKISHRRNVPTICITGTPKSLAARYADIVISTHTAPFQNSTDQTPIIMAVMTIINVLQIGYSIKNADKVKSSREDILAIAEFKRYKSNLTNLEIGRVKV